MSRNDLPSLRQQLESNSDTSLHRIIELMEASVAGKEQALQAAQEALTQARGELTMAREVAAARPGLLEPGYRERWSGLLDTLNRAPERHDQLQLALRELMFGRQPLIMSAYSVRQDNRQTVLAVLVPTEPDGQEALYLHLLKLLPLLVNEANPEIQNQAATLEVRSRALSDKESLTLVAHPAQARYEVLKAWRSEESQVFSGHSLRDALTYLGEHHPY